MKHYVYALDTDHGVIIDAIPCHDERAAKIAYVHVKGQGRKCYNCRSIKYGFSQDAACISYWSGEGEDCVEKSAYFSPADFEFAAQQTKKRWQSRLFTVQFMREVHEILKEINSKPIETAKITPMKCIGDCTRCLQIAATCAYRTGNVVVADTADSPLQVQAATGKGVPGIVEAYNASIEDSDGSPANVRDKGMYSDVLRALVDSQHPDEKYRHWVKWKSGVGYTDIAKSENRSRSLCKVIGSEIF